MAKNKVAFMDVEFSCSTTVARHLLFEEVTRRLPSPSERVDSSYIEKLSRQLFFIANALEERVPVKVHISSSVGRPWAAILAKARGKLEREFLKPFAEEINPFAAHYYIAAPHVLEVGVKGAEGRRYFLISEEGVKECEREEALSVAPDITPLSFSEFLQKAKPLPSEFFSKAEQLNKVEPGELPQLLRELARMLQEQLS
ncbi:MAG: hypothetical protein QXP84_07425 [Candidatus Korarchaeum sp.]